MEYVDEKGITWDSYKEYVWGGLLGYCGCYDGQLYDDVFKVLFAFNTEEPPYYDKLKIKPLKYVELILHDLDRAGLIEHGTAIRGSWLTEKGHEIIEKLELEEQ